MQLIHGVIICATDHFVWAVFHFNILCLNAVSGLLVMITMGQYVSTHSLIIILVLNVHSLNVSDNALLWS